MQINESNGYEIQRQVGKYYALKMQEELFGSTKYIGTQQGNVWNSFSFTVAQAEFIKSKYSAKRYAMLAEGVWWENEANPTFVEIETLKAEKKYDTMKMSDIVENQLGVVDLAAAVLCMENKMSMCIFGLNEENSIINTVSGACTGTIITVD